MGLVHTHRYDAGVSELKADMFGHDIQGLHWGYTMTGSGQLSLTSCE